jgi:hypothetical protein
VRHRVQRTAFHADGTSLTLSDGRSLHLSALPDPAGAPRVRAVLRRITRVDVAVDGDWVTTRVHGIAHRRQCTVPVSVETALALAMDGCPCSVDLAEDPASPARSSDEVRPA